MGRNLRIALAQLAVGLRREENVLTFFGRSFAVDPYGRVLARAPEDDVA